MGPGFESLAAHQEFQGVARLVDPLPSGLVRTDTRLIVSSSGWLRQSRQKSVRVNSTAAKAVQRLFAGFGDPSRCLAPSAVGIGSEECRGEADGPGVAPGDVHRDLAAVPTFSNREADRTQGLRVNDLKSVPLAAQ